MLEHRVSFACVELDSPGEFYVDTAAQKLYLWHNVTGTHPVPPPSDGSVVGTQLACLFNVSGASQHDPVRNISFTGIIFRDTAATYMEPHGTPSGGDVSVLLFHLLISSGVP